MPEETEQKIVSATYTEDDNKNLNNFNNAVSKYASNTTANDVRDKIIEESYDMSNSTDKVCDVLGKYKWNIDTINKGMQSGVPYCYLIEYKQERNSVITNLINSISAAVTSVYNNFDSLNKGFERVSTLGKAIVSAAAGELSQEQKNAIMSMSQEAKKEYEELEKNVNAGYQYVESTIPQDGKNLINGVGAGLMTALKSAWDMIGDTDVTNGISNNDYLKPYSLLYWLKATEKKYIFPMLYELPKHKLLNAFGDNNADYSVFSANSLLTSIGNFASEIPSAVRDFSEFGGKGSFSGAFIEKAKFFQYPQETDEYTIQFPLINTVRTSSGVAEWKKNYKFIMLFTIRNMIYRKDNAEYYPPLFYDLCIPGVIRQPFCYVSSVDVQPFGMTRMKEISGLFKNFDSNSPVEVPVPELWIVTIKVKSLVPTSANMVLSSLYDLPIAVKK